MLLLLSLLACDDQIFTGGGGHSSDAGGGAEAILAESCGGCHASSLAPTLSENLCENTVDVMATQVDMPFIAAGDPANSYLLHKMKGTAGDVGGVESIMPPTGALSDADIQIVEDWIAAGAVCSDASTSDTEDTGDVQDTGAPDDTNNLDQSIPEGADPGRGNDLFNQHCSTCHINGYAPDPQSVIPMIDNAAIETAITQGVGGMAPVSAVSDQVDINDIIAFLRTTYPADPQGGDTNEPDPNGGGEVDVAAGEELANINCNGCHVNGAGYEEGDPPPFDSLIPYMAVEDVESVIQNGTSGGMPSFTFTQEEMNNLTFYLAETYNSSPE